MILGTRIIIRNHGVYWCTVNQTVVKQFKGTWDLYLLCNVLRDDLGVIPKRRNLFLVLLNLGLVLSLQVNLVFVKLGLRFLYLVFPYDSFSDNRLRNFVDTTLVTIIVGSIENPQYRDNGKNDDLNCRTA